MIRIEFNNPSTSKCECCGNETTRLTRYVFKDEDAYAVYYASFTKGHSEKIVYGLMGMGEWSDDNVGPEARIAFGFEIWEGPDQYHVGLIDAEESPWSHTTVLGRILDREDALQHEWIKEVFHITDHIVSEDKEVIGYFNSSDQSAET